MRHLFLAGMADWATGLGADETSTSGQAGKRALFVPGATLTFWSAPSGGTQYTDLLDNVGNPLVSVTADSAGELPEIQGPDTIPDTWVMWADGNNGAGPRRKVMATDLSDAVNDQATAIGANTTAVTSIQDSIGAADGIATLDSDSHVPTAQIPNLDAGKVTSGTLGTARIPDLSGSYLTQSAADARYPALSRSARSDLGIYVPAGWGAHWRAKLAAAQAGTGIARLVTVGGSSTHGYYASRLDNKGWPGLIRDSLQATYRDGGSGFKGSADTYVFQQARGVPAAAQTHYQGSGDLVALTSTWSDGGNPYGPGSYYIFTQTTGATATFTVRGTTVSIYTAAGGSPLHANWTYKVDGGATVNVTDQGGATAVQKTTITGLSAGSHTILITYNGDGTKFLSLIGVAAENTSGVVVHKLARYGAASIDYAFSDPTICADWNGGPSFWCDLAVYTCAPNDAGNNISGDTYARRVRLYLDRVRDGGTLTGDTDIMLVLPHIGTMDTTNVLYQDYAARLRGLAESYGAALVDMWTIGRNSWNYWNSLGYWANSASPGTAGNDSVHPSDAGHQFIADTILPILTAT